MSYLRLLSGTQSPYKSYTFPTEKYPARPPLLEPCWAPPGGRKTAKIETRWKPNYTSEPWSIFPDVVRTIEANRNQTFGTTAFTPRITNNMATQSGTPPQQKEDPKGVIAELTAEKVLQKLKPLLELQNQSLTNLMTQMAQLLAQMVVLQQSKSTKTTASRAPRAGGAAATSTSAGPDYSKVKNSMLWQRMMYMHDEEFRKAQRIVDPACGFTQEQMDSMLANDSTVASKTVDSKERLSAEARIIWRTFTTAEKKEATKTQFEVWKKTNAATAMAAPLTAENSVGGVIPPADTSAAETTVTTADLASLLGQSDPF